MAKKKIEIFIEIKTEKEFQFILDHNRDKLICADVYCEFSGPVTVLDHLFTRIKLDWSDGQIILLRVPADHITAFARFRNQSRPLFLFILNRKITKIFRGVDNIRFAEVAKREVEYFKQEQKGVEINRPFYDLDVPSPEEVEWFNILEAVKKQEEADTEYRRTVRQAARKRHRAELMVPELRQLNFVLFWPHSKHAHPELYERWDLNNIIMIGREEIQLSIELAEDILYGGDAPRNEASMNALMSAAALAICFRLLDTDKHFVSLVRKILYEDVLDCEDDTSLNKQRLTAFDQYKSYSLTKEEILRKRAEEKLRRKEEIKEQRARRLSEMQRLAKQAIEEAIEAKRAAKERRKLELLKSGNLAALEELKKEPDDEEVDIVIPEELPEDVKEESSDEDENEYFPPSGLLVAGFYAPPNDVAKANGLAILFPNIVLEHVTPEPEYLPPHVLVLLDISIRYRVIDVIRKFKKDIIHIGIFKGKSLRTFTHIAYSVKEFDRKKHLDLVDVNVALMVSVRIDLALLELMELNPSYVSRDVTVGEEDCALIFNVEYGDNYPEFEDVEQ